MAILDDKLKFASDTSAAGNNNTSALVGDVLDLDSYEGDEAKNAIARGAPLYLTIAVRAAAAGENSKVQFELKTHSAAAISGSVGKDFLITPEFVQADLAAGAYYVCTVPYSDMVKMGRYLGVVRSTTGANMTGIKVDLRLEIDPPQHGWVAVENWRNA